MSPAAGQPEKTPRGRLRDTSHLLGVRGHREDTADRQRKGSRRVGEELEVTRPVRVGCAE